MSGTELFLFLLIVLLQVEIAVFSTLLARTANTMKDLSELVKNQAELIHRLSNTIWGPR